jgi:triacylglycerol esterase/lipase EstA (alpha/beta hydrolase family)
MIVFITRLLIALQLAAAAGFSALAIRLWKINSPMLAFALGIGAVFIIRLLIPANSFFLTYLYNSAPVTNRLDWRQKWRLFMGEFNATMMVSSWTMPFHSFHKRPAKNPTGLPVLLLHGFGCNSGYWHGMSQALTKSQITHHAINLEPMLTSIDAYIPAVQRAIDALRRDTGSEKIILLTHSMGGLIARAYLCDHGTENVARVITLGAPHHGTALAKFGVSQNCQQMRWIGSQQHGIPSKWLRKLSNNETVASRALFTSIYSLHDNIISPQASANLPGANNITVDGIGHVALALHPAVQVRVIAEIQRTSSEAAANCITKSA